MVLAALLLSVPVAALVALSTLTAVGARRRGAGVGLALLSGLCFPVAWTLWYLRDEHPYARG